jgi:hypothetical protein
LPKLAAKNMTKVFPGNNTQNMAGKQQENAGEWYTAASCTR